MNDRSKLLFISLLFSPICLVVSHASIASPGNNSDRPVVMLSQASLKQAASAGNSGNCELAYPDFCLKSADRDLDCDDIPEHRNFRVLPPDPYQFDRDKDGIGCEGK